RFVDDHKVPLSLLDVRFLGPRELVGADDNRLLLKGIQIAALYLFVESLVFKNGRRQKKLIRELLTPLFAKIGRHNDQEAALAFSPLFTQENPGLDCFA